MNKEQTAKALLETKKDLNKGIKKAAAILQNFESASDDEYVVAYTWGMRTVKETGGRAIEYASVQPELYGKKYAEILAKHFVDGSGNRPTAMPLLKYLAMYITWAVNQIASVDDLIQFNNSK